MHGGQATRQGCGARGDALGNQRHINVLAYRRLCVTHGFMLTHDGDSFFHRRGRSGTKRFRQKTLSPYPILFAISAAPREILTHAGA